MAEYTKGPWHLEFGHQQRDGGAVYWQVHDGSDAIACNQFCLASNAEANARLIAAAPDLLEALKNLAAAAAGGWPMSEELVAAGYAIAKAEAQS